jgi:hypothetical protein
MHLNIIIPALFMATSTFWSVAHAEDLEVDAELVLAVDVSRSMTQHELEIQRRGYAAALTSNQVIAAITGGLLGRVAITYFEWAGDHSHRVIVDWKLVSNRIEAEEFASQLTARFDTSLRRTSISGALDFASSQFDNNGFTANRRIIDVSGDGPNNQGRPVLAARADSVEKGIIINGLPLMTREGMGSRFHLDNLDEYYRNCVIAGPGSFVLPVTDWQQFPVAVRQKLVLELAIFPTYRLTNAAFISIAQPEFDCMIGEKIWQQRWQYLDDQ